MTSEEVLETIKDVLSSRNIDTGGLTMESRLVEDLMLDSLEMFLLMMDLEDYFGICYDVLEIFKTVGDVCSCTCRLMAAKSH